MMKQKVWAGLLKRAYAAIDIQRHAGPGVPEPARQLDSEDALLVPEGGTPVPEQVRVDAAGTPHGVTKGGPFDPAKWLDDGDEPRLYWDPSALTGLAFLGTDAYPVTGGIYVTSTECDPLTDPHSRVFKQDAGKTVTSVQKLENGQELVRVGGLWYEAARLRDPDGDMAGWILIGKHVEDHPDLPDVSGDRAGTQPVADHVADPSDDVGGGQ